MICGSPLPRIKVKALRCRDFRYRESLVAKWLQRELSCGARGKLAAVGCKLDRDILFQIIRLAVVIAVLGPDGVDGVSLIHQADMFANTRNLTGLGIFSKNTQSGIIQRPTGKEKFLGIHRRLHACNIGRQRHHRGIFCNLFRIGRIAAAIGIVSQSVIFGNVVGTAVAVLVLSPNGIQGGILVDAIGLIRIDDTCGVLCIQTLDEIIFRLAEAKKNRTVSGKGNAIANRNRVVL